MDQLHRHFTVDQVKDLLRGYCPGPLSRADAQEVLGRVGEPERLLPARRLRDRICHHFGCGQEPDLAIPEVVVWSCTSQIVIEQHRQNDVHAFAFPKKLGLSRQLSASGTIGLLSGRQESVSPIVWQATRGSSKVRRSSVGGKDRRSRCAEVEKQALFIGSGRLE